MSRMSRTTLRNRDPHAPATVREAATRLRVSEETIRRRFDDGSLRGFRLGSVRRIFASELERLEDRA
jgi:excisionase family DNA binding protein